MSDQNSYNRKYYEANREKIKEQSKKYYYANKEKSSANAKAWRAANREKKKADAATYREANKEKITAKKRADYRRYYFATRIKKLLGAARARATKRGLAFDIDESDISVPEFCPLLGTKLNSTAGGLVDCSPSIDRKNSTLGYVKGNVWIISYRANVLKNNSTADELIALGTRLKELLNI